MEDNKKKDQDESIGKQSTAETDVTYNLDTEELRHSATTSMVDENVDTVGSEELIREEDIPRSAPDTTDFER